MPAISALSPLAFYPPYDYGRFFNGGDCAYYAAHIAAYHASKVIDDMGVSGYTVDHAVCIAGSTETVRIVIKNTMHTRHKHFAIHKKGRYKHLIPLLTKQGFVCDDDFNYTLTKKRSVKHGWFSEKKTEWENG